ncbi:MAG: thiamine phosphate synthase [Woeseia sp.]
MNSVSNPFRKDGASRQTGIVYLVIDPSVERAELLEKTRQALDGGADILQIWNRWPKDMDRRGKERLVASIKELALDHGAPLLINEEWDLLKTANLDGVHFDAIPEDFERIRGEVACDFIAGITCSNDLEIVRWAEENGMDYVSFCAMFPSLSVGDCEIVRPETVREARELTSLPLLLSGGITPGRIDGPLRQLEPQFDGVAVISGILDAAAPGEAASAYKRALSRKAVDAT